MESLTSKPIQATNSSIPQSALAPFFKARLKCDSLRGSHALLDSTLPALPLALAAERRYVKWQMSGSIMSLKDDIEKLIRADQANLENRDNKHADYHQRQHDRFASLRVVLEEISASIDPRYLKSEIGNYSATIELGRTEGSTWSTDTCWKIEPNYDFQHFAKAGESLILEKAGFKLEETKYYRSYENDISEKTQVLPDEQAISQYLIEKIADRVAHYRHMESLAAKRMEGK